MQAMPDNLANDEPSVSTMSSHSVVVSLQENSNDKLLRALSEQISKVLSTELAEDWSEAQTLS